MSIAKHIQSYYRGERITHIAFAGYGLLCLMIGYAYYFFKPGALSYGVLFGLGLIGTFQILVGIVRFGKTFNFFKLAEESNQSDSEYLKTEEFDRIEKGIHKLKKMRTTETLVFIVAFLVFSLGSILGADKFLLGTALGLCFHAATLLIFDLFSQSRTQEYQHQLGKNVDGWTSDLL